MAKWNRALSDASFVDQKLMQIAMKPAELKNGEMTDYGFAFRSANVNGIETIEHGGGVFGYSGYGIRIAESGVYVIILTNFNRKNAFDEVAARIAAIVCGRPYDHSQYETIVDSKQFANFIGSYRTTGNRTYRIMLENDQLFIRRSGRKDLLKRIENLTFLVDGTADSRVTFFPGKEPHLIYKPRRALGIKAIQRMKVESDKKTTGPKQE